MVMKVLEPLWTSKPETAGRVRGRIEAVLDWSKVRGFRAGENPARWRGTLTTSYHTIEDLPGQAPRALPYRELGAFMRELRTNEGTAAAALEFLILTPVGPAK